MRACHAAGTEWNCLSEQSNLVARGICGTLGVAVALPQALGPTAGCSPAALKLDVQRGEGLGTDQVVHDARCVRVVRTVVKLVHSACGVFKALIPAVAKQGCQGRSSDPLVLLFWGHSLLLHIPCMPLIGDPNGFGQVPKHRWVGEVKRLRDVVLQDPRELGGEGSESGWGASRATVQYGEGMQSAHHGVL